MKFDIESTSIPNTIGKSYLEFSIDPNPSANFNNQKVPLFPNNLISIFLKICDLPVPYKVLVVSDKPEVGIKL